MVSNLIKICWFCRTFDDVIGNFKSTYFLKTCSMTIRNHLDLFLWHFNFLTTAIIFHLKFWNSLRRSLSTSVLRKFNGFGTTMRSNFESPASLLTNFISCHFFNASSSNTGRSLQSAVLLKYKHFLLFYIFNCNYEFSHNFSF